MTLYEKIMQIYPDLQPNDFLTTIVLQNDSDGKGDYIAQWNNVEFQQPTEKQLADIN